MKDIETKDITKTAPELVLRKPVSEDGSSIWKLVRDCKPLDENSMYCNLLQCDHFADTCVLAELDGRAVGWVSGYVRPDDPETVFVWQVAVHSDARGLGLGGRLLSTLMNRRECDGVTRLQTTITRSNAASWALFRKFADRMGGTLSDVPHFEREDHFEGQAATEHMVTIRFEEETAAAA